MVRRILINLGRLTISVSGDVIAHVEKHHKENQSEAFEKAYRIFYHMDIEEDEANKLYNELQEALREEAMIQRKIDTLNEIWLAYTSKKNKEKVIESTNQNGESKI